MFNSDQFYEYIEKNKNREFKYGVWDCFTFVGGYWDQRSGKEFFPHFKNKYMTYRGYRRVLKNEGYSSLLELMKNNYGEVGTELCNRGDVVVYRDCLGLCDGVDSIFLGRGRGRDYSFILTKKCTAFDVCGSHHNG